MVVTYLIVSKKKEDYTRHQKAFSHLPFAYLLVQLPFELCRPWRRRIRIIVFTLIYSVLNNLYTPAGGGPRVVRGGTQIDCRINALERLSYGLAALFGTVKCSRIRPASVQWWIYVRDGASRGLLLLHSRRTHGWGNAHIRLTHLLCCLLCALNALWMLSFLVERMPKITQLRIAPGFNVDELPLYWRAWCNARPLTVLLGVSIYERLLYGSHILSVP